MAVAVTLENALGDLLFSGTGRRRVSVGMLVACSDYFNCNNVHSSSGSYFYN